MLWSGHSKYISLPRVSFSSSSSSSCALPLFLCFIPFLLLYSFSHALSRDFFISLFSQYHLSSFWRPWIYESLALFFLRVVVRVQLLEECVVSPSSVALSFASDWDLFGPCCSSWASSIPHGIACSLQMATSRAVFPRNSPPLILEVFTAGGPVSEKLID